MFSLRQGEFKFVTKKVPQFIEGLFDWEERSIILVQ